MGDLSRSVKVALAVSLISLLFYVLYVTRGSYVIVFGYLAHLPPDVSYVNMLGLAFWASLIGVTARLIGVITGLTVIFLLWVKSWPFMHVKKFVAAALILESLNFIGLVPSLWLLFNPHSRIFTASLGYNYLIQIVFIVPVLWLLAFEVTKYKKNSQLRLLKVGALTFVGYTVALVTNEVSRWATMINRESLRFIEGIRAVGFYNAVVFMPFAVIFALVGAVALFQQKRQSAMRWFGASLTVIGLNYVIYLAFVYSVHSLNTLPVVDIWTIPLLALGIALIFNSRKREKHYSDS